MTDRTQKKCKTCGCKVLAVRPSTNHLMWLFVSILTMGFGLILWVLAAVKIGGWRCTGCGGKV